MADRPVLDGEEAQVVEITPEMVAAGVEAFRAFSGSLPETLLIAEIYAKYVLDKLEAGSIIQPYRKENHGCNPEPTPLPRR